MVWRWIALFVLATIVLLPLIMCAVIIVRYTTRASLIRGAGALIAFVLFYGGLVGFWYLIGRWTGYGPAPCDIPGTSC
jgi:hypothetical protein